MKQLHSLKQNHDTDYIVINPPVLSFFDLMVFCAVKFWHVVYLFSGSNVRLGKTKIDTSLKVQVGGVFGRLGKPTSWSWNSCSQIDLNMRLKWNLAWLIKRICQTWYSLYFTVKSSDFGEMMYLQGRQICQICFLPSWKGFYSKRKEFVPNGSKFFPFRIDHFREGIGGRKENRKWSKIYHVYSVPLQRHFSR